MPQKPNFASIQLALFFKDAITTPEDLWPELKATDFVKTFDETPLIIPLSEDPEYDTAPTVTLTSKNSAHRALIARRRADLFWLASDNDERELDGMKEGFHNLMKIFFEKVSGRMDIIRLGYVLKFFFESDKPESQIVNLLSADAKNPHGEGNLHEASVKIVTRVKMEGMEINNNSSLSRGEKKTKDGKVSGIILTRDFNTIPERKEVLSWEQVLSLCTAIEGKLNLDRFQALLWPSAE